MASLNDINKAYDILREYKGSNPFIFDLKKKVEVYKGKLTDFQIQFVNENYNFTPINVNKIVTLTEWYAPYKQKEWGLKYIPTRIHVGYVIGETETTYACYVKYSQTQKTPVLAFLAKKGVVTQILVDDYEKTEIDFDYYDNLSRNKNIQIKDFQKTAVKFLVTRKRAILADSQGYGKTIESIIAMLETKCKKALIICPASLKTNWRNELRNYVDDKDIEIINGSHWKDSKYVIANYDILDNFYTIPQVVAETTVSEVDEKGNITKRKEIAWKKKPVYDEDGNLIIQGIPKMKVSNNKELVRKAMEESQLYKSGFGLVIIDEVHKLCNSTSGRYKIINDFLKRTNPPYIFLMSGTPISNRPYNFYNVLKLIDAEITKDWRYYVERYCDGKIIYLKGEKWKWTSIFLQQRNKAYSELNEKEIVLLNDFLLKNAKHVTSAKGATNLDELKERTKHIYLRRLTSEIKNMVKKEVIIKRYDLSEEQREEYDNLWTDYEKVMIQMDAQDKLQNKSIIESSLLRQFLAREMCANTIDLAEDLLEENDKLIIMCCYDEEIDILKKHFGKSCVVYNGKMTTSKKDEAEMMFKTYDHIKVFIGNIISAGVGLNLQVAHTLIFNSFEWVSGSNSQSEDRVFRQTQTKDCQIYYQLFRNTFSEEMYDKVLSKERNINDIIKKESEK